MEHVPFNVQISKFLHSAFRKGIKKKVLIDYTRHSSTINIRFTCNVYWSRLSSWLSLLDIYLKFLNLFDTSRVGYNFPCNVLIKLDVVCEILDERPKLSKKYGILKILLDCNQCETCINKGSWESWTLIPWLRNSKLFCFGSFIYAGVMLDEHPKLSTKWWISGKLF